MPALIVVFPKIIPAAKASCGPVPAFFKGPANYFIFSIFSSDTTCRLITKLQDEELEMFKLMEIITQRPSLCFKG
jgi:hypothetical protein